MQLTPLIDNLARGKWKISLTMDYRMIMELKGKQLVIKKKNIRRILQVGSQIRIRGKGKDAEDYDVQT
eukprot:1388394-Amorphochlora_amoeboformis.AAC.1